jgi:predicted DNA-binding transcriptional regulator YafY
MPENKNIWLRYKTLDSCLSNPGRKYTIKDLKSEVEKVLSEADPNSNGVSFKTLRNDLKFMESERGYNAPIIQLIEGRKRYYKYEVSFSINDNPINQSEWKMLEQAVLILKQFHGRPDFEWLNQIEPFITEKTKGRKVRSVVDYDVNLDYKGLNLIPIIQNAILNKIVLEFNYRPFKGRPYHALCHPYYLKQFNGRWYVFGRNENENKDIWQFPLDRIENLKETYKIQFKEDQMENWQDYFYDIVGVTRFDEKVEKIIMNVSEEMIPYIITKPLHPTQKVRKIDDQRHEVEIKVIPNLELISLILSFGLHIKVKEPSGLKNRIKEIVRIMYMNYTN